MRRLYSLGWWLVMPLVLARLWWRGRREPGYRANLAERFGSYSHAVPERHAGKLLWVHAVSVGETRAAEPLVDALLARYPDHALLLTHMTPTGRATGRALFARYGERVIQSYLPYDTGSMTARFLRHFQPRLCVLMETEVWPGMIASCRRRKVPVALVNARLSERSLARANKLGRLMREAADGITCVAAQTEEDAERLRRFGVVDVHVTGSIKFDVLPPQAAQASGEKLRAQFGQRPVLLCASTREGEEALILAAFQSAMRATARGTVRVDRRERHGRHERRELPTEAWPGRLLPDDMLLVIVPRHPQRFGEVALLVEAQGLAVQRRSALARAPLNPNVQVLVGDTMGEMFAYFAACDIAFIGGSLLPLGGQNLIEACALGKPVVIGLHTFNFGTITTDAIAAGAAVRVADGTALFAEAGALFDDPARRQAMGRDGFRFAERQRGATARTMTLLDALLLQQAAGKTVED